MALKCIEFTDGTKLAIFAENVEDGSVSTPDLTIINYTLQNAYIAAANPGGGFINNDLNGKSFVDGDGNTWAFARTSSTNIVMSITNPGGQILATKNLDRSDNSFQWISYTIDSAGNYQLHFRSSRPINRSERQTSGNVRYLRVGYINGLNGNHNYIDDIELVQPSEYGQGGYINSQLRNAVKGSPFVSITGIYLTTPGTEIHSEASFYSGPYSGGSSSDFITVTPNAVDDYTEETPDPYEPGGETGPGGGGGDFDGTSEDIDFPDDPTLSAVDTGFLTLFNPSLSQLNDLANFMWGSIFDIENWKKLFANPMDAILGLSMVPVSVPNGGTGSVKVGNIDTGVSMTKAARQYVNVDCGTINVKEYWGAYLDYSPYTKAEIFLPYIGTHEVSVDDIMGKTVHIKYKVDILSGACVANIKCGGSVLYSYSGQCAATIPITGRDWTQTLSAALSVAGNVLSIAASQGMTAPMAATNIAQSAVNAIKPNIQKTGNIGGMAGIMGIQKPYIILTRPRQAVPKNQNKYTGYPSFITAKLSKCGGYTEVEKIHLDSTSATQDEIKELETLLDKGVIF